MVCNGTQSQRVFAATVQLVWQRLMSELVENILQKLQASHDGEGIVLVGGGALNVIANQLIRDKQIET